MIINGMLPILSFSRGYFSANDYTKPRKESVHVSWFSIWEANK